MLAFLSLQPSFDSSGKYFTSPQSQGNWAAMTTCFFGFLRAGKVCSPTATSFDPSWHLCIGDLALYSHAALTKLFITIKASKMDPFREGVTITLGIKTGLLLCPMMFILSYIARRGAHSGPSLLFQGWLFPHPKEICEGD